MGGLENEIYDEPESPNEGASLGHMMRGVFKICDEPRSPHEGAWLGYMMNLNRPRGGGGVFKICDDELESRHEGACLSYIMMSRNRHMKGLV